MLISANVSFAFRGQSSFGISDNKEVKYHEIIFCITPFAACIFRRIQIPYPIPAFITLIFTASALDSGTFVAFIL